MVPNPAIRNLIRDDKVHQIYSTMQTGQEKLGMQTMNQSLATLYQKRLITLEAAMNASSLKDELEQMIARGAGVVAGAGMNSGRAPGCRNAAAGRTVSGKIEEHQPCRHLPIADGPAPDRPSPASASPTPWTPPSRRCGASRSMVTRIDPAKAAKAAAKPKTAAKGGVKVPSKNLAIFTRQFSVMIDAGLPLVQCLDILGKQEPRQGLLRRHPEGRARTSSRARRSPTR